MANDNKLQTPSTQFEHAKWRIELRLLKPLNPNGTIDFSTLMHQHILILPSKWRWITCHVNSIPFRATTIRHSVAILPPTKLCYNNNHQCHSFHTRPSFSPTGHFFPRKAFELFLGRNYNFPRESENRSLGFFFLIYGEGRRYKEKTNGFTTCWLSSDYFDMVKHVFSILSLPTLCYASDNIFSAT